MGPTLRSGPASLEGGGSARGRVRRGLHIGVRTVVRCETTLCESVGEPRRYTFPEPGSQA